MKRLAAVLGVSVLLCSACNEPAGEGQRIGSAKTPTVQELSQLQVKLPPSPSFQTEHPPTKYPDSTFSVYGLRADLKKTLDNQVKVKGFIIEVYECPPCPKGSKCPDCKKPHFWLADKLNTPKDKALMVTDYPKEDPTTKKKVTFEVKTQYFVTGLFALRSGTGFASSEGVLRYASATPVAAAE